MIKSFRHKGLKELFETGRSRLVAQDLRKRCLNRLDALNAAGRPSDVNIPGFHFHALNGTNPTRYTIRVSGPWRITFQWEDDAAAQVDLEPYH